MKPQHYESVITGDNDVCWFEIHPENYFQAAGKSHQALSRIADDYPLSMHGVGMSLGSADGLDMAHLKRIKSLCDRYQPAVFSEHLSWSRYQQFHSNDLLPIPYTESMLTLFKNNVDQAQDFLGRQILIENPSSYFLLRDNDYTEWDFLVTLCQQTDARILLDVNNLYVSAVNHGFDPLTYLHAIPAELISEIHLAGHSIEQHEFGQLLIDDHGSTVSSDVWHLYQQLISTIGPRPTLIEWDTNIPDWSVLVSQAQLANHYLDQVVEVLA